MAKNKDEEKAKIKEIKEQLSAVHRNSREEEKASRGGSLPFQSRKIVPLEPKDTKKQRRHKKNELRKVLTNYNYYE